MLHAVSDQFFELQRHDGEFRQIVLARIGERSFSEFFQQRVRFTIDDAVALENRNATAGFRAAWLDGE